MELTKLTIAEMSRRLAAGEVTSVQLAQAFLDRIAAENDALGAFITVTGELALSQAAAADERRSKGEALSPVDGIPYALEDNYCTVDVLTSCASLMLADFVPTYSATAYEKLTAAGAVLLGKVNMDEFGFGASTETSYYGAAKNPANPEYVGGVAACVAAGMTPAVLCTYATASAALSGVVALTPSYGRISRNGIVATASSLDMPGVAAATLEDAAMLLNIVAGHDSMDAATWPEAMPDLTACGADVTGMKIGIPAELLEVDPAIKAVLFSAAAALEAHGAVVETISLPHARYAVPAHTVLTCAEGFSCLGRYSGIHFGYRSPNAESLDDIYTMSRSEGFGHNVKRTVLLGTYVLGSENYEEYYKRAQRVRTLIAQDFDSVFAQYDCLLAPALPCTAWKVGENRKDAYACTAAANLSGLCSMTLPYGNSENGLPIALQLLGAQKGEVAAAKAAAVLEAVKKEA